MGIYVKFTICVKRFSCHFRNKTSFEKAVALRENAFMIFYHFNI